MGRRVVICMLIVASVALFRGTCLAATDESRFFRITYKEADGGSGYYKTAPDIQIKNLKRSYITRYQVRFQDGTSLTGRVRGRNSSTTIPARLFGEGTHELAVWADTGSGNEVTGTRIIKKIRIDSQGPEKAIQFLFQKKGDAPICFCKKTIVTLKAEEQGSGIRGIYYQLGNGKQQYVKGASGTVEIPLNFRGTISAYAIDQAGNKGKTWKSKEIIVEQEKPKVHFNSAQDLTKWSNENVEISVQIQESGIVSGIKKVECYINGECFYRKEYYEKKLQKAVFSFDVEEEADIIVYIEDFSGNYIKREQKILIDKQAPTIQIEGEETFSVVKEDVRLKCSIYDQSGIQARKGEIHWEDTAGQTRVTEIENWNVSSEKQNAEIVLCEEGVYQVILNAEDFAGNESEESFQIIIDKSAPVIREVEELEEKTVSSFQWDYSIDQIISDYTSYTYEMRLNGTLFEKERLNVKQGAQCLEIIARDAAGNETIKEIHFVIDSNVNKEGEKKFHKNILLGVVIILIPSMIAGLGISIWKGAKK